MGERNVDQELNKFSAMIHERINEDPSIEEIESIRKTLLTVDNDLIEKLSDMKEERDTLLKIRKQRYSGVNKRKRSYNCRPLCNFTGKCQYKTHKRTRTSRKLSNNSYCTSVSPCNQKNGSE